MTGVFLVAIAIAFSNPLYAEENEGDVVQTVREAVLRKDASESAPSLGRIPSGTLLTAKGQRKGNYVFVEVELEDGQSLEGWVKQSSLDRQVKELESLSNPEKTRTRIKQGKVIIPEDEDLLLHREPSFVYGAQAGGNFALINTSVSADTYSGFGAMAGGLVGFFASRTLTLRLEVNFVQFNGSSSTSTSSLAFNFLEGGLVAAYMIEHFEIFGGFHYAYGLGLGDIPSAIKLNAASDLSTFGYQGGLGYHFSLGDYSDLVFRARYDGYLATSPFAFQGIGAQVALEFRG